MQRTSRRATRIQVQTEAQWVGLAPGAVGSKPERWTWRNLKWRRCLRRRRRWRQLCRHYPKSRLWLHQSMGCTYRWGGWKRFLECTCRMESARPRCFRHQIGVLDWNQWSWIHSGWSRQERKQGQLLRIRLQWWGLNCGKHARNNHQVYVAPKNCIMLNGLVPGHRCVPIRPVTRSTVLFKRKYLWYRSKNDERSMNSSDELLVRQRLYVICFICCMIMFIQVDYWYLYVHTNYLLEVRGRTFPGSCGILSFYELFNWSFY